MRRSEKQVQGCQNFQFPRSKTRIPPSQSQSLELTASEMHVALQILRVGTIKCGTPVGPGGGARNGTMGIAFIYH